MNTLVVAAKIVAKPESVDFVKSELLKLVPITLKEDGCIMYSLHQDNDQPENFLFLEKWESLAHLEAHLAMPHLAAYAAATQGHVTVFEVQKLTCIDVQP